MPFISRQSSLSRLLLFPIWLRQHARPAGFHSGRNAGLVITSLYRLYHSRDGNQMVLGRDCHVQVQLLHELPTFLSLNQVAPSHGL